MKIFSGGISFSTLVIAMAFPAYAQEAATTQAEGGIADIIVTATKRAESVNTVPMSISAASGDQLAQAGITDITGLSKIVPGFSAIDSSYGTPVYFIRGVGFYEQSLASGVTEFLGTEVDLEELPERRVAGSGCHLRECRGDLRFRVEQVLHFFGQ